MTAVHPDTSLLHTEPFISFIMETAHSVRIYFYKSTETELVRTGMSVENELG